MLILHYLCAGSYSNVWKNKFSSLNTEKNTKQGKITGTVMVLGGNTPFIRAVAPYIAQPLHIGSTVKNVLITSGIHS